VDFAEVTEDDLQCMGVPLLHKRRFTQAAVQVEEVLPPSHLPSPPTSCRRTANRTNRDSGGR
jgi:hypothetical protein